LNSLKKFPKFKELVPQPPIGTSPGQPDPVVCRLERSNPNALETMFVCHHCTFQIFRNVHVVTKGKCSIPVNSANGFVYLQKKKKKKKKKKKLTFRQNELIVRAPSIDLQEQFTPDTVII
jgi:hypothetical protein